MKKILLITNIFPPHIGGPATFIDRVAHHLAGLGYRVTVVCSSDQPVEESDRQRPFKVCRIDLSIRELYEVKVRLVLFREILRHRNILVNGLENYVAQIAPRLGRSFILKVVGDTVWETARNRGATALNIDEFQVDPREQQLFRPLVEKRNRFVKLAKAIFTPSEYLRRMVIGWGADPSLVTTILNGIDPEEFDRFSPIHRGAEPLKVVFVGRLTNWKGVETLLLAARELDDIAVTVVGDGPEFPHLVELARQLGVDGKVIFTGRQNRSGVQEFVSAAHVLVLTSLYEGLSHTLLEAMGMGVACIASSCGGNVETIQTGKNGLLIPPQNVAALVEALRSLRDDEGFRFSLACEGKADSRRFSINRTVDDVVDLVVRSSS